MIDERTGTVILIVLFVATLLALVYIVFRVAINEGNKKKWLKNIKDGDFVEIHSPSSYKHLGAVKQLDEDTYEVRIVVSKRWIYPPKFINQNGKDTRAN